MSARSLERSDLAPPSEPDQTTRIIAPPVFHRGRQITNGFRGSYTPQQRIDDQNEVSRRKRLIAIDDDTVLIALYGSDVQKQLGAGIIHYN